jgi:hypothetical protein
VGLEAGALPLVELLDAVDVGFELGLLLGADHSVRRRHRGQQIEHQPGCGVCRGGGARIAVLGAEKDGGHLPLQRGPAEAGVRLDSVAELFEQLGGHHRLFF